MLIISRTRSTALSTGSGMPGRMGCRVTTRPRGSLAVGSRSIPESVPSSGTTVQVPIRWVCGRNYGRALHGIRVQYRSARTHCGSRRGREREPGSGSPGVELLELRAKRRQGRRDRRMLTSTAGQIQRDQGTNCRFQLSPFEHDRYVLVFCRADLPDIHLLITASIPGHK